MGTDTPTFRMALPIDKLELGEIAPVMDERDESWDILEGWEDPLAPRAGYRVESWKALVETDGERAVEWTEAGVEPRALVTGRATWRDYTVECRMQALQAWGGATRDCNFLNQAAAGIVFRMETSRRYYFFCIEGQYRLVLYRRIDDDWHELGAHDISKGNRELTLKAELDGDGIRVFCPELDVSIFVTDTLIPGGKAGFRARGQCRVFDLSITMSATQEKENRRREEERIALTAHLGQEIPDEEEVRVLDLGEEEEILTIEMCDFCESGRADILSRTPRELIARKWDGTEIWRTDTEAHQTNTSAEAVNGSRRIYITTGVRKTIERLNVRRQPSKRVIADKLGVLDGGTGKLLAETRLPEKSCLDDKGLINFDLSYETGRLKSAQAIDVIVRQWHSSCGGGGKHLWAYDGELNLFWDAQVNPAYGHHNAVHMLDIDGDGRSEVMAGGTLLSADGKTLSVHDMADEHLGILGGQHYDAVVVGDLTEDPDFGPVAFLMGGSSGVYVINPLTGRTHSVHRVGHAQWGQPCKLRDDIPGKQVLVGTRWSNYGIMTLFSARGERLWSIQPDYLLQGTRTVQWLNERPENIWHNTSPAVMGLYDGYGRLAKPLDRIRKLVDGKMPGEFNAYVLKNAEGSDLLCVQIDRRVHCFGPREV